MSMQDARAWKCAAARSDSPSMVNLTQSPQSAQSKACQRHHQQKHCLTSTTAEVYPSHAIRSTRGGIARRAVAKTQSVNRCVLEPRCAHMLLGCFASCTRIRHVALPCYWLEMVRAVSRSQEATLSDVGLRFVYNFCTQQKHCVLNACKCGIACPLQASVKRCAAPCRNSRPKRSRLRHAKSRAHSAARTHLARAQVCVRVRVYLDGGNDLRRTSGLVCFAVTVTGLGLRRGTKPLVPLVVRDAMLVIMNS